MQTFFSLAFCELSVRTRQELATSVLKQTKVWREMGFYLCEWSNLACRSALRTTALVSRVGKSGPWRLFSGSVFEWKTGSCLAFQAVTTLQSCMLTRLEHYRYTGVYLEYVPLDWVMRLLTEHMSKRWMHDYRVLSRLQGKCHRKRGNLISETE